MVAPLDTMQAIEDERIDGEVLCERDLIDADGPDFALPDGVDQEWLLGELWKDLLRGEHARAVLAEAEQRRIIETSRQLEHQMIEGIGQLRCRVSLDTYLHWTSRYGADFWKQEDSLQFFAKRNPGFLVDNFHHRRSVHTVDGFRDANTNTNTLPAASGAPALGEKPVAETVTASATVPTLPRSRGRGRWSR